VTRTGEPNENTPLVEERRSRRMVVIFSSKDGPPSWRRKRVH